MFIKSNLNYQEPEIVNIYDEVNLWTAPFGRLLLENMPMKKGMTIVDVGFGTGFPLIELSQRFGEQSKIYGIDIWEGGIERTKEKIETLQLSNIQILNKSAINIALRNSSVDLITSNLGVNNFDERGKVYSELHRILKKGGKIAITTNPVGTFKELFNLFEEVLEESGLTKSLELLTKYIANRNTDEKIIEEFSNYKFTLIKKKSDYTNMKFMSGESLLNHSLMRIGFREGWDKLIQDEDRTDFYEKLCLKINNSVSENGVFTITIPLLYLEFEK